MRQILHWLGAPNRRNMSCFNSWTTTIFTYISFSFTLFALLLFIVAHVIVALGSRLGCHWVRVHCHWDCILRGFGLCLVWRFGRHWFDVLGGISLTFWEALVWRFRSHCFTFWVGVFKGSGSRFGLAFSEALFAFWEALVHWYVALFFLFPFALIVCVSFTLFLHSLILLEFIWVICVHWFCS